MENLEDRMIQQEAKEDYFQNILSCQRWTFGTVVSLFALFSGVVGFGVFRRYVNRMEDFKDQATSHVDERVGEVGNELSDLKERVEKNTHNSFVNRHAITKKRRQRKEKSENYVAALSGFLWDIYDLIEAEGLSVYDRSQLSLDLKEARFLVGKIEREGLMISKNTYQHQVHFIV